MNTNQIMSLRLGNSATITRLTHFRSNQPYTDLTHIDTRLTVSRDDWLYQSSHCTNISIYWLLSSCGLHFSSARKHTPNHFQVICRTWLLQYLSLSDWPIKLCGHSASEETDVSDSNSSIYVFHPFLKMKKWLVEVLPFLRNRLRRIKELRK